MQEIVRGVEASAMTAPLFEFQLSIEPVAKERPRSNRKSGAVYTPTRTVQYERELAKAMIAAGAVANETDLIEARCTFGCSGWRLKDGDNLVKSLLDAGNKVLYADDAQCIRGSWDVQYDVEEPFVRLELYSLGARPEKNARSRPRKKAPLIADCACGQDHMDMPTDPVVGPLVCIEHKRHLPCRSCRPAQRQLPSGYDLCSECQRRAKPIAWSTCRGCRND